MSIHTRAAELAKRIAACVVAISLLPATLRGETDEVTGFMRAKLLHSQRVLEGLTTENFAMVAKHSQAMGLLSQDQQWRVLQTPDYFQRSAEFRRSVETLTEAAKKENLDGATLAFVDVTMKCVECHKYVRRIRQARNVIPEKPGTKLR